MESLDIYFTKFWGKLNAELESGVYNYFEFSNEDGEGFYHFIKRKTPFEIDGIYYYDIITPYGFNGPILSLKKNRFIEDFENAFQEYCYKERIITEYVRFSPWLKNHIHFQKYYDIYHNKFTLYVDLTKNFFLEEFSSKCRNSIRKAIKSGVKIEFDFYGNSIDNFDNLYNMMACKNNISKQYRFEKNYFKKIFEFCRGHVFLINALYGDEVISSAMFLSYGKYIHYHFSGNHDDYKNLCANNLVLYEAANWGKENGKTHLHLGGASSESLFRFKKTFTKYGIYDYYIGKKIRNNDIYDKMKNKCKFINKNYFPEYRG